MNSLPAYSHKFSRVHNLAKICLPLLNLTNPDSRTQGAYKNGKLITVLNRYCASEEDR